jgi:hypothetical protein
MEFFHLISKDNKKYSLSLMEISLSHFLRQVQFETDTILQLDIYSDTLDYIVEYLQYKKGGDTSIQRPLLDTFRNSCNDIRDYYFIETINNNNKLDEVFLISDYLQIDGLLHLISAFIALNLKMHRYNLK